MLFLPQCFDLIFILKTVNRHLKSFVRSDHKTNVAFCMTTITIFLPSLPSTKFKDRKISRHCPIWFLNDPELLA